MRPPLTPPQFRVWKMSDGYPVHGRLWPPARPTSDISFLYLHGIQSHGGWYEWSASLLATTGAPVLLPDRRGSGLNTEQRGDAPAMERWLADLDELAGWLEREYGTARVALVGVSWGGKPATAWAMRNPRRAARLLLIAPGLFPRVGVGVVNRLKIGGALLTGCHTRLYPLPLDDPRLFTANPAGQSFIAQDTLKLTQATARFLYFSSRLDHQLARAAAGALQVETTLFLAENDQIIRNRPTETWLGRLARPFPRIFLFPFAEHTVEFEKDVTKFETLTLRWATQPAEAAFPAGGERLGANELQNP